MRHIVLSVNGNPDYVFYAPLVAWSWQKIGWHVILLTHECNSDYADYAVSQALNFGTELGATFPIEGFRSDTITQVSRLFGWQGQDPNDYILTGDIDMMALSSYWEGYDEKAITAWGYDLTDYTEYPICYLGATARNWRELMSGPNMENLLKSWPNARSTDFYKYWGVDQQILTDRIKNTTLPVNSVLRGKLPNGYAVGRVDRGSWSLNHERFIDCHMHRDLYKAFRPNPEALHVEKFAATLRILYHIWPDENFDWLIDYTKQFAKLAP